MLAYIEDAAPRTQSPLLHVQLLYAQAVLASDVDADEYFQRALAHDLVRWSWVRARIELAYGSWLRRRRRVVESRARLRAASDTFDRIGAVSWAQLARTELRAAGERSGDAGPELDVALSPQELEIARLAAEGLSNREIGQRLMLSHRTIGAHLYRIFPKLGITSRRQLVARVTSGAAAVIAA